MLSLPIDNSEIMDQIELSYKCSHYIVMVLSPIVVLWMLVYIFSFYILIESNNRQKEN